MISETELFKRSLILCGVWPQPGDPPNPWPPEDMRKEINKVIRSLDSELLLVAFYLASYLVLLREKR